MPMAFGLRLAWLGAVGGGPCCFSVPDHVLGTHVACLARAICLLLLALDIGVARVPYLCRLRVRGLCFSGVFLVLRNPESVFLCYVSLVRVLSVVGSI